MEHVGAKQVWVLKSPKTCSISLNASCCFFFKSGGGDVSGQTTINTKHVPNAASPNPAANMRILFGPMSCHFPDPPLDPPPDPPPPSSSSDFHLLFFFIKQTKWPLSNVTYADSPESAALKRTLHLPCFCSELWQNNCACWCLAKRLWHPSSFSSNRHVSLRKLNMKAGTLFIPLGVQSTCDAAAWFSCDELEARTDLNLAAQSRLTEG